MGNNTKEWIKLMFSVVTIIGIALVIGLFAYRHQLQQDRNRQACLANKYTGVVYIDNSAFCYRLLDHQGSLVGVDLLPQTLFDQ